MKTLLAHYPLPYWFLKITSWRRTWGTILFIVFNFTAPTLGQIKIWDKTLGGTNRDLLTTTVNTTDGGYLLGGYTFSPKSGDKSEDLKNSCDDFFCSPDFWVVKVDKDGKKVWDKSYGGDGNDELAAIVPTPDGGYLLGGSSQSGISGDKTQTFEGVSDYWVVKINGNGVKQWDKTYRGINGDFLQTMIATPDGGYLLGGSSDSPVGLDKTEKSRGEQDYWVVKIDGKGTKLWDRNLGSKANDQLKALAATYDGGYIVAGITDSSISGDKSEVNRGKQDFWVVKINNEGQKEFDKTIGGNQDDLLSAVVAFNDGSFLLAGTSASDKGNEKSEASRDSISATPSLINGDYWLVKLNNKGKKLWDKTFGGPNQDYLQAMALLPDGGVLLGGYSDSDQNADKQEDHRGSSDYWIVKTDAAGERTWDKTIGGLNRDILRTIIISPDGNCLVSGNSESGIGGDKKEPNVGGLNVYPDFWAVKIQVPTKTVQTIAFPRINAQNVNNAPFALAATASSGLPITYSILSGPATIKGNIITVTDVGIVTIKARQAGNATYSAAEFTQVFRINRISARWDKTIGGNNTDHLYAMATTPDGGYILAGDAGSGKSGEKTEEESGFWIVRTTNRGIKIWDKTLIVDGYNYGSPAAIINTPDNGFLIGGTSASSITRDKTQASRGGTDYWLVKLDANGNKLWDKIFGGTRNDVLNALVITPDGNYLAGGTSISSKGGDKSEINKGPRDVNGDFTSDYWLVKFDNTGNKIWDKTIGGTNNDNLASILVTSDGNYLLGGSSKSETGADKSQPRKPGCTDEYNNCQDFWIVKADASGNKLWDKTLGAQSDEYLNEMIITPDGGYLLGGSSNSRISDDKSEDNRGKIFVYDYWIIKIDDTGNKQWDKTFGGTGNDQLNALVSTSDNGFLLAGMSLSGATGDKSEAGLGDYDYWAVKVNATGNKVWDETFGTSSQDLLTALVVGTDGSYLLGGSTAANTPDGDKTERGRGGTDYWLVNIQDEQITNAQWNMRYGGSGTDNFTSAIKTKDGGYLAGGYTNSGASGDKTQTGQGKNDYWIVKTDKNGHKQWDKRYGGSGNDYLNRVIQTQDGGYLLAGSSLSGKSGDKSADNRGDRDYWIVKTDALGSIEWDKTFGGTGYDELKKVVQLSTGQYVLGGYSNSPVSGDKTQPSQGGTDYWVVKLSYTGTKLWDKRYGGAQNETLGSFAETKDRGFLLGGTSWSGKSGDKTQQSQGTSDYWVVKTNISGNLVWEKTFGGTQVDEVYSVGRGPGESVFIAGTSSSGKSGDKSQASQGGKDYWLVNLDENGNKSWDKTFGGSQDDELRASTYTSQGHYILAGHSYSGVSGNKTQASQGENDFWIVEVDKDGNALQDNRYGGSGTEELRTVFQTPDGGLLLGGRSESGVSGDRTQPSQGGTDYWLVKVAPATSSIIAARTATQPESKPSTALNNLVAYPNPFQDRITLTFLVTTTQPVTLTAHDSQGRKVTTLFQGQAQAKQQYEIEWQAKNQAAGLYFLRLETPGKVHHQKVLLTK